MRIFTICSASTLEEISNPLLIMLYAIAMWIYLIMLNKYLLEDLYAT